MSKSSIRCYNINHKNPKIVVRTYTRECPAHDPPYFAMLDNIVVALISDRSSLDA